MISKGSWTVSGIVSLTHNLTSEHNTMEMLPHGIVLQAYPNYHFGGHSVIN